MSKRPSRRMRRLNQGGLMRSQARPSTSWGLEVEELSVVLPSLRDRRKLRERSAFKRVRVAVGVPVQQLDPPEHIVNIIKSWLPWLTLPPLPLPLARTELLSFQRCKIVCGVHHLAGKDYVTDDMLNLGRARRTGRIRSTSTDIADLDGGSVAEITFPNPNNLTSFRVKVCAFVRT